MAGQSTPTQTSASVPSPIVTTTRLIIRPMHLEDAPNTSLHANDPLIAQYMRNTFPNPYTRSSAEQWINMNLVLPYQHHFVICERSSPDVAIGGIGLKLGMDVYAHTAEVGFWIGKSFWGKGYTTEALEAFTTWSFESYENNGQRLTKLYAGVFSGNVGSMRCFEKNGYALEGVLKGHIVKNGEVKDEHMFGMTKSNWERRMNESTKT
ncbi:acyl-CoA N-acyltransferase [Alternaria alternata]|nr:acyl-CoA N-acyltransferase [Alternaria alternata]